MIIAIIKPFRLEAVRQGLAGIGIAGMTVTEVSGFGRQHGHTEIYRSAEYRFDFVSKLRLEIAVEASRLDEVAQVLATQARTGKIGDGKLFVFDLQGVLRIRTGERGADAL